MKNLNVRLQSFYYKYRGSNALRLIKKTIGISIIASLFIGLFVFMAVTSSFIVACKIFAGATLIVVLVGLGVYLASS